MPTRRKNNTTSASASAASAGPAGGGGAIGTRNRRQITSMPEPDDECVVVENPKAVVSKRSDKKRVEEGVGDQAQQNEVPVQKNQSHKEKDTRTRTSNDENNDPRRDAGEAAKGGIHSGGPPVPVKEMGPKAKAKMDKDRRKLHESLLQHDNILEQYSQLNANRNKDEVIFFVIVDPLSEVTCSSRLSMAYQLCSDHNMAIEWIREKDCLSKIPQKGNSFVVDPFEGPVYEYLISHFYSLSGKFKILGPQCLRQSFEREKHNQKGWEIPNRAYPMFTLGMSEVIVTLSGFRDKVRKEKLLDMIQKMGGFYTSSFTLAVTHVVADTALSEKCIVAFKSGIPVMKADWVEAVWKESLNDISKATDVQFLRYACPIFHNVNTSFSGIDAYKKDSLRKIIESNGGVYSGQLIKGTTQVLIIERGTGEKFRYAKQWNMQCLKPEWITDSKLAGYLVPTEKYQVRLTNDVNDLVSTQIESKANVPLTELSVSAIVMDDVSHCSQSDFNFTSKSQSVHSSQSNEKARIPPRENNIKGLLESVGSNLFLDGCRIYISGSKDNTYEQVKKIISRCGATRLDQLGESVSHVVVIGANMLDYEAQTLRTLNPRPHLVTVEWIFASARKGDVADVEEFAFIEKQNDPTKRNSQTDQGKSLPSESQAQAPMPARVLTRGESSKGQEKGDQSHTIVGEGIENEDNFIIPNEFGVVGEGFDDDKWDDDFAGIVDIDQLEQQHAPANRSNADSSRGASRDDEREVPVPTLQDPDRPTEDNEDDDNNGAYYTSQGPSQFTKIFVDYQFDVVLQNAEDNTEVKDCIKSMGGTISKQADIVILPPVYNLDRPKPTAQLFTKFWVMDCVEVRSPNIQMQFYHVPMKTFTGMRKLLSDVVIAVSGYPVFEKKYIEEVAIAMGARFQDVFARKTSVKENVFKSTHLICCVTDNEKYRAAMKWNVPVIRHEWLIECFNAERKLDFSPFRLDKADTKGSILVETPKANRSKQPVNIIARTGNQPEKFKAPLTIFKTPVVPLDETSITTDEETLQEPQLGKQGSASFNLKTPDISAESSPYIRGLSRSASRHLKTALSKLTSDSPSPDFSSIRIRLPRNSTPEGEAFAGVWSAFRKKFPGRRRDLPGENAPDGLVTADLPHANNYEENEDVEVEVEEIRNSEETSTRRTGLKRPSDPESTTDIEDPVAPKNLNSMPEQLFKRARTTESIQAIMNEELGTLNDVKTKHDSESTSGSKSSRVQRRLIDSQLPLPPDVPPETETEEGGKVYWDENKERPLDTHKRVELSQVSHESGEAKDDSGKGNSSHADGSSKNGTEKTNSNTNHYTFMLTGFADLSESERIGKILIDLGGNVNTKTKYEEGVDALIAKKYARSEKVLSCIAAGRPMVSCSYVFDSEKAGRLLDLTDFILKPDSDASLGQIETQLIGAAYFWYTRVKEDPNAKPFSKVCAIIVEQNDGKRDAYKNLIRTGGGIIWKKDSKCEPNVIIGEEAIVKKKLKSLPKVCATLRIQSPFYLNNVILKTHLNSQI